MTMRQKFFLLASIAALAVAATANAATKYVSNSTDNGFVVGNDTNNGNSPSTPYLTVNKGVTSLADAGGDTLEINPGTYTGETTAALTYFRIKHFHSTTTIQRATGTTGSVIIKGLANGSGGSATYNIWIGDFNDYVTAPLYLVFNNITFQMPDATKGTAVYLQGGQVTFNNCSFIVVPSNSSPICLHFQAPKLSSFTGGAANVAFNNCTFGATAISASTDKCHGIQMITDPSGSGAAATDVVNGVSFTNCAVTVSGIGMYIGYITEPDSYQNITITGCSVNSVKANGTIITGSDALVVTGVQTITITNSTFTSPLIGASFRDTNGITATNSVFVGDTSYGCQVGGDSTMAGAIDGTFTRCMFMSYASHTLLVGYSCDTVVVSNCVIRDGNYGVVLKHCVDCTVKNSLIVETPYTAAAAAVYLKAGSGTIVRDNTIIAGYGAGIQAGVGDSAATVANAKVIGNLIVTSGAGIGYSVASTGAGNLSGTQVWNNKFSGTTNYGAVGNTTNQTTFAGLTAAWTALDANYSTNDTASHRMENPKLFESNDTPVIGGGTKKIGG